MAKKSKGYRGRGAVLKAFGRLLRQGSSPTSIALWHKYTETFYPLRDSRGRLVMD